MTSTPCPCGKEARIVGGERIYPHRRDLYARRFFLCECGRYVGAHPNGQPKGTPADAETRAARMLAHEAFDPLWQRGPFKSRGAAYRWLAERMGKDVVHIAEMDAAEARRVVTAVAEFHEERIA